MPLDDHKPQPMHCVFTGGGLIAHIERQEDVRAALVPLVVLDR